MKKIIRDIIVRKKGKYWIIKGNNLEVVIGYVRSRLRSMNEVKTIKKATKSKNGLYKVKI